MVGFDIGDNRHHRLQMQERCITLICFGNQAMTMPQTRMNARRFYQPTVNEGWVESRFCVERKPSQWLSFLPCVPAMAMP